MKTLKLIKRADNIAVISFDLPDTSVNVLSRESLADLQSALDQILRDPKVRACVLTSEKKDNFLAGADLGQLAEVTSAKEAEKFSRRGQDILNRIANGPIPFVAAVHGMALGGGLEVILACHSRIATDDPKTVFALPEVQLGLLPAAGGTQRLPRLIGLSQALPLMLSGSRVRAKKALKLGLVDQLVARENLLETAVKRAILLVEKNRWRSVKNTRLSKLDRLLPLPIVRSLLLKKTREQVLRKTRGKYPAPLSILKCVEAGLNEGIDRGLAKEAELFGKLVVSPESKNLVWIFHASRELKKLPQGMPSPTEVKKLAVIGAGLMGEGIASVSLPLNDVILKDLTDKAVGRAKESIRTQLTKRVQSGSLTLADEVQQLTRLMCVTDMSALKESELVIEAVFEDLALKRKVLNDVEKVIAPSAVFASNTSALPISKIAEQAKHPERILGMHYFSPVPKMPLLEIVVMPKTSKEAIATAQSYGIAQGKTVIVVKDGPGFYTTRILAPLLNESMLLLEEGASVEAIDNALKNFGFPVGPIALLDEVGIDVGAHVAHDLGEAFGKRWGKASGALNLLIDAGYKGKKCGKGFYVYSESGRKKSKKEVDPKIYGFFGGKARLTMDAHEIAERVAFMMINEAVYCLQEEVILNAHDGDIGAIMGLGFPPFLGGPFHYLDQLGLPAAVARMKELSKKFGPRFEPAPLLEEKSKKNGRFYEISLS